MASGYSPRVVWMFCILGFVAAGLLSRVIPTGFAVLDKYLGDALYAMMVYGLFRLWLRTPAAAASALVVMTAIELFQLTMIPARLLASQYLVFRICARLMGLQFGLLDLLAYGVGIGCVVLADLMATRRAGTFLRPTISG